MTNEAATNQAGAKSRAYAQGVFIAAALAAIRIGAHAFAVFRHSASPSEILNTVLLVVLFISMTTNHLRLVKRLLNPPLAPNAEELVNAECSMGILGLLAIFFALGFPF